MPTAEQLARLAAIGRQSVALWRDSQQTGTLDAYHRSSIGRIRTQGRQSITVIEEEIEEDVPAAPGNVSATTLSSSTIRITFDDVANETGYKIFRASTNDSAESVQVGSTEMNVTEFTDSGLTASTTYYYWAKATNANGDSVFSSGTSSATSSVTPNFTLEAITGLTYKGAFRLDFSGYKFQDTSGIYCTICAHPDSDKLYFTTGRTGTYSRNGAIWTVALPGTGTLAALTPGAALATLPLAQITLIDNPLPEYIARHPENVNAPYGVLQGIDYDAVNDKLWANFARYYHVQPEVIESVAELSPTTGLRIGDYLTMDDTGYAIEGARHETDCAANMCCLAGTPLASYGDFLTRNSWISPQGPRLVMSSISSTSLFPTRLIYYWLTNQWNSPDIGLPSSTPRNGVGRFIGSNYVFPYRDGTSPGWYGRSNGFNTGGTVYLANGGDDALQTPNWVPDAIKTANGPHAPPYRSYMAAVPTSQLIEVINETRSYDACDITLVDVTNRMYGGVIDGSDRFQASAFWDGGFCKQGNYYFAIENHADSSQAGQTLENNYGAIIHVFEEAE